MLENLVPFTETVEGKKWHRTIFTQNNFDN